MILLLSGEGPTDLGHCDLSFSQCSNDESGTFISGVLTYIIDDIFNSKMNYSIRETLNSVHFVHKSHLCEKIKKQSGGKKLVMMRGAKKAPETNFYFNNAKSLGLIALELQEKEKCPVIAILFRDSDGTRSTASNDWKTKYDSMVLGFDESGCNTGVPMLAKPKSEAWLLAACKNDPYQHCHLLENESGNESYQILSGLHVADQRERQRPRNRVSALQCTLQGSICCHQPKSRPYLNYSYQKLKCLKNQKSSGKTRSAARAKSMSLICWMIGLKL